MVLPDVVLPTESLALSVLALSSRFDGHHFDLGLCIVQLLSVLALSSRFDGRCLHGTAEESLRLSVLALSSRFDGPATEGDGRLVQSTFSTRSVESF